MSFSISASGAHRVGPHASYCPAREVAISVMPPMPTEWWLRPVSSACRVGEHSAVVWKRLILAGRLGRELLEVGRVARAAEGARRAEADVVDQHDEHVGRALRRAQRLDRRVVGVRILARRRSSVPTCLASGIGRTWRGRSSRTTGMEVSALEWSAGTVRALGRNRICTGYGQSLSGCVQ